MSTIPESEPESAEEQRITRQLRELPQLDLPPLASRALLVEAQRALATDPPERSWLARQETAFLLILSAAHLGWALLQVLQNKAGQ